MSAADGRRDPVLDLVRAAALVVVVVWHWSLSTLRWSADGPHVGNPIGVVPGLWLLTWAAQVMPLFFLVGGALHARDRRRGGKFLRHRLGRLVPPVLPLLGLAAVAATLAAVAGRADVVRGVVLMVTPLWFLGVYVVLVLLAPAARWLDRRWGLRAVVVGAVLVVAVDRWTVFGDVTALVDVLGQYVLVWAVVHQLGFHLDRLRRAPRRAQVLTCLGGVALLAIGARWGGYPGSMVGAAGDRVSNMSPPNSMVLALAVAQLGGVALLAGASARWCERHAGLLARAGAWSMSVYVWHMLALAAFWAIASHLLGLPPGHRVDAAWWSQRPLWLVGPLVCAVPVLAAVRRRRPGPVAPVREVERAR